MNKHKLNMINLFNLSKSRKIRLFAILPLSFIILGAFGMQGQVINYKLNPDIVPYVNIKDLAKIKKRELDIVVVKEDSTSIKMSDGSYTTRIHGQGLRNSNVVIRNTNAQKVFLPKGGDFLPVNIGDTLTFSALGYLPKRIIYKGEAKLFAPLPPTTYFLLRQDGFREMRGEMPDNPTSIKAIKDYKYDENSIPLKMPEYKDGLRDYFKEIKEKVTYATENKKLRGVIIVKFTINGFGQMVNMDTYGNSNYKIVNEAIKIIAGLDKWSPAIKGILKEPCTLCVELDFTPPPPPANY